MTAYTVAPLAQADLDDIWAYVAQDKPSAADKLIDTFHEKFRLLARNPLLGQLRQELRPNLRSFSVGNYVVYYQASEARMHIVRVLHGARDSERLL